MAEANKCDVIDCGEFSEGAPAGNFVTRNQSRGMCQKHTDALINSYFPDLKPEEPKEPEAQGAEGTSAVENNPEDVANAAPVEGESQPAA